MHCEGRPRAGAALAALLFLAPPGAAANAPPPSAPQELVRRHFGVEDGLPVRAVTALAQDGDGFLWVGTFDGLARFDGARFRVFTTATHPELGSNRVTHLLVDGTGDLWVRTEIGDVLRYREGRFEGFPATALPGPVSTFRREGDAVWLLGLQGTAVFREGRLRRFAPDLVRREARALLIDRLGHTWLGDGPAEVVRISPGGTGRRWAAADGLPASHLEAVYEDRTGTFWLGFTDGTVVSLGPDERPRPLGLRPWGDSSVHLFHEGDDGQLWIGAEHGWYTLEDDGSLRGLAPEVPGEVADGVQRGPDGRLWRVQGPWLYRGREPVVAVTTPRAVFLFDAAGALWVSEDGLVRYGAPAVVTWSVADGLPGPLVYPLLEDREGTLWAGAWGGDDGSLARQVGERFETVLRPSASPDPVYLALALFEDRRGDLWVGSLDRPVCRIRGPRCELLGAPAPIELQTATRAMAEDRRGRFWIGGEYGLLLGSPTDAGRQWQVVLDAADTPRRPWIRGVLETRDGEVLFATAGLGVLRWRGNEPGVPAAGLAAFESLTTAHGLASEFVRDLHEDGEGVLWVATEDRGLCRIDRRGHRGFTGASVACLGRAQGLFDDSLHRILEDGQGRLWLSGNRGISWVRRSSLEAWVRGERPMVSSVAYDERHGMRDREANGGVQPAGVRASDGRLWFPTQDGVVVIDPAAIPFPEAPRPVIDRVRIGGEESPAAGAPLDMAPGEIDLEVAFTAAALAHPEALRFRYRLAGYEEEWRYSDGSRRLATYTGLPPGRFVFELEAGLGGAWSAPVALPVERRPFVWQTPWFALACLALLGAVLASAHRLRLRTLRSRARHLERTVEERTVRLRENEAQLGRQAEELRRANELKSRFLAHVSHELRTPLTLTFGPLDDLAAGRLRGLTEEARPHLERARRNGDRLERLIDQLLDLSRLEASTLRLRLARVDLAALVRRWTSAFESLAASRGVELRCEAGDGPRPFVTDPARLETVLYNLIGNALDFTPAEGSVTVELRDGPAGEAVIIVRDTGAGIPPEHLPHVFERFYQADSSATRRHEGLGIGLALSRELVELHAGRIEVESEPGEGTTFTVTLPTLEAPAEEEAAEEPADQPGAGAETAAAPDALDLPDGDASSDGDRGAQAAEGGPRTAPGSAPDPGGSDAPPEAEDRPLVLVVEDNADMRDHLRALLEAFYRVEEAADGARGLALARELVPDAVVSDVTMPELDGFSLLARLRDDPRTSHVPVLLLTARADLDSRIAGYEAGTDAFLSKPFRGAELLARLQALLEQRRRLRRAFSKVVLHPEKVDVPDREREFLDRLRAAMEAGLAEPRFNVDELAAELFMSRRQLLRKVQALTGEAPGDLLRRLRLERAAALLRGGVSVKEAARAVGFRSAPHFSQAFREAHGATPAAYRAERSGEGLPPG